MENLTVKPNGMRVTGDISVEPVTRIPGNAMAYIIMGPTGAGKSSFIEALAGGSQNLAISSNQLAGYTQRVTAYKLVNVQWGTTQFPQYIYLIDTPGFSDDKISEIEVMKMLLDWMKENCSAVYFVILFLTPITVTRLPGSRRRTINMIKESLHSDINGVIVTTTMWDTLHTDRARSRAEKNFEQLRAEIFTDFFGYEANLKRFIGTRSSALEVIDRYFFIVQPFYASTRRPSTQLYRDLHERIKGALQKKAMIESDLAHSDAQTNKSLKDILERGQKENDETLAKFVSQLVKFGQLQDECQEAAQALRKTIVDNIIPSNHKMWPIFHQWVEKPEVSSGLVADRKLTKTILAILVKQHTAHQPSWNLNFIGSFR